MKQGSPPDLKTLYRQGRVMPFVGAGASMSVSWKVGAETLRGPSWGEMVDEACRQLDYDDSDLLRFRGTDLQILEYFEEKKGNFAPLTNWLVRRFNVSEDVIKASKVHSALSRLDQCTKFYTTNYDDFLERSLSLAGRSVKVIAGERDMGANGNNTEVVKFHGDFNSPDQMVFSEGHYYKRMRLDGPLDLKLRSDLLGRAALFIGYSFRDLNVGYLFDVINAMFKSLPHSATGRRAYIVAHNPSDFEYTLFRKRNIEILPTFGEDKTASLVDLINDIAA
jgi:SIR2-like domain